MMPFTMKRQSSSLALICIFQYTFLDEYQVKTNGWIGFGIGEPTSGMHSTQYCCTITTTFSVL
jgi:hypothetical protein